MTGIIASAVQFFFAWRVKVVTGNWWLVALISTCALTGMRMAIFICCMHYLTVHPGSLVHWYFDCGWDNPRVPRIHQIQSNCNCLVSTPSTLHSRFSLISLTRLVAAAIADVTITVALTFHLVGFRF